MAGSHQTCQTQALPVWEGGVLGEGTWRWWSANRPCFPRGTPGLSQGSHNLTAGEHRHALGRPQARRSFVQGVGSGSFPSKEEMWSKGRLVF